MKIICYGDSNTYGYDPRGFWGGQYVANWSTLLAEENLWVIQNEGENGRGIPKYGVSFPDDTDLLIIMLGTNDLLQGACVKEIADRMNVFLNRLTLNKANILLVAPPPMYFGEWVQNQALVDASVLLAKHYQELAEHLGVHFADAGQWGIPLAFDGVHFTEIGHMKFYENIRMAIERIINNRVTA